MQTAILITAAGRGMRAGGDVPKQYQILHEKPVLRRTVEAFSAHPGRAEILCVINPADEKLYHDTMKGLALPANLCLRPPCHGADTRQGSILAGLRTLAQSAPDLVLIHDAARPFVSPQTISSVLAALENHPAALPGLLVADTLKRVQNQTVSETVPRQGMWLAQTPQGFDFDAILKAHEAALLSGKTDFTDDASIAEWAGLSVRMVVGNAQNIKLTTADDMQIAAHTLKRRTKRPAP